MFNISANGIIELHRGDTINTPIYIDVGTALNPECYTMVQKWEETPADKINNYLRYKVENNKYYGYIGDAVYFAILEPNQKWEDAIVKKAFTAFDFNYEDRSVELRLDSEDTEYLEPGNYYYEVKLYRCKEESSVDIYSHVDTIIGRTKFVIME